MCTNDLNATGVVPVILPPAFAEGVETPVSAQSRRAACAFVDAVAYHDPETERCHALWRAVICQQIMDAKNVSLKPEKQLLKKKLSTGCSVTRAILPWCAI